MLLAQERVSSRKDATLKKLYHVIYRNNPKQATSQEQQPQEEGSSFPAWSSSYRRASNRDKMTRDVTRGSQRVYTQAHQEGGGFTSSDQRGFPAANLIIETYYLILAITLTLA